MPQKVAERWGIATVHDTPEALIEDPKVEIVDLAFPPDQQPALIRHALKQKHIKAILAQKPLALSLEEAIEAARRGEGGRQDPLRQPEHALRPVDARAEADPRPRRLSARSSSRTIDMHAIPHWQTFLADYDRLTLSNMSVHHLDVLRFLFGDPSEIYTLTRTDPRTTFEHKDGITVST